MRRLVVAVAAVALLRRAPGAGAATETNASAAVYTLEDCIRIGLERSGTAANARRDESIALALIEQTRSEALPHAQLRAGYTRLDELEEIAFEDQPVEVGTLDNYSAGAGVNQLLFSGGRLRAALRAAGWTRDLARWSRLETDRRLVLAIRTGFYGILLADAARDVAREARSQYASLLAQTEEKLRQGTAAEFDLLSARVRLANEEPVVLRAENACALAREDFRRLVNLDDGPFDLKGGLDAAPAPVNADAMRRLALAGRALIHEMTALVALRAEDVNAARAGLRPTLGASFNYSGANSYGYMSFEDDWQWHWNAGLRMTWDVWDGRLTRGRVAEKRLEFEKARTDLDETRKSVKLEVTRACLDMARAGQSIEAARGNVELAEKALAIARTRYETGLANFLEFAEANVALSRAKLSRLLALRDYRVAEAELKFAAGSDGDVDGREDR